jgi:ABC-type uncharacterized transport system permease subunit
MIRLEKRKQTSRFWTYVTPILAVVLTMIFGGVLFAILGKDPAGRRICGRECQSVDYGVFPDFWRFGRCCRHV